MRVIRSEKVLSRLKPDEKAYVLEKADELDITASDFIRDLILTHQAVNSIYEQEKK